MRPLGKSSKLEERRIKAVKLVVEKKWTQAAAAKNAKVSLRTMQVWIKSYRER
ncbi:MAG: helix-turn-helix domain-containing protein [Bdellovibrio sp.]